MFSVFRTLEIRSALMTVKVLL